MMLKKSLFYVLGILLSTAIIFGIVMVIVQFNANNKFTKSITLTGDGVTQSELGFSASGLKPADSREYTLQLNGDMAGTYSVKLEFSEEKDNGLGEFINVTCFYEDNSKDEFTLNELFDGKTIEFDCEIENNSTAIVRMVFTMPREVGNEAQGTDTDFSLTLTAKRK